MQSLARFLPAFAWLARYQPSWLRADIAAGITLAAYLLPAGLGDASLAQLPPEAGLYACLFSGLVFWLFCSSRHTSITVTSAISLLIGTSLGELAGGDTARFGALAACTALLVSALALAAWLLRAGVIVNFISETVLVGFKTGVACVLAVKQFPKLLGFAGGHGNFWENLWHCFSHLRKTHTLSLLVGLGALAILILGKKFFKNKPVALVVVVGGIMLGAFADLGNRGVALMKPIPKEFPALQLPAVTLHDLNTLLPLAMACFLLGAVETIAIGRMFGLKHGYRVEPNQEFLALAASNLAAGLGRAFPVSGGMSQSLVNESGGAKTPLSGLVAAVVLLIITLFCSGLLRTLPQPVLAAIVLMAVTGLFKLEAFKRLWRFSRSEFTVAFVATLGVLGSGILRGVLIGAVLSIIILLRRAARPHVAVLGRVPGASIYGDIEPNPENVLLPGVFIFRVDSAILYFNADFVRERFLQLMHAQPQPVKVAIWCLATTPIIDLAGAEMLEQLHHELAKTGIALRLAEARGPLRESLRAAGLEACFGPIRENATIDSVSVQPDVQADAVTP